MWRRNLHLAQIDAVDLDRPAHRIVKSLQQRGEAGLAPSAGADQRYHLAGRDIEADPAQNRRAVPVRERDVAEADGALDVRDDVRARRLGDVLVGIQDREHHLERGRRASQRLIDAGETLHRDEEPAEIAEKREQRTDRDLAVQCQVPAVADHRDTRERGQRLLDPADHGVEAHATHDDVIGLADLIQEAAFLGLLHREASNGQNATQHFIEARIDAAPAVEQRAVPPRLFGRGPGAQQRRQGNQRRHDDEQPPFQPCHQHQ